MKTITNNATIIANSNAIKAIGTLIVVSSSSVSSFASMVLRWRSDMRGWRSHVGRSVVETNVMGFLSHYFGLHLAGLKPVADPACCAYRITQTCPPHTA